MESKNVSSVSVVLSGIGGYGLMYLSAILDRPDGNRFRLAAVADPFPERCSRLDDIHSRSIPIFRSLDDFFRNERADMAILSSPIQWHSRQACLGLEMGSHVLCEKPLAATVQDAGRIIRSRNESGKQVAVGYQWSFSMAIRALKENVLNGDFGKPIRLKTLHLWPRDEKYYRRNEWAGRKCDASGGWILDSPANNAFAHELHNMFFLLGGRIDRSCLPVEVMAKRGHETLAYGPLRPIGLRDPRTEHRPWAVVQLRQENLSATLYNLVGFQTNLKWTEQARVFRMIPGLAHAEFERYGMMHRNTFINAPQLLEPTLQYRGRSDLFFAGQITGVEGYVGNVATGYVAGLNAARVLAGESPLTFPPETMIGALCHYITHANTAAFQPKKASFGILPPLVTPSRAKNERNAEYVHRARQSLDEFAVTSRSHNT